MPPQPQRKSRLRRGLILPAVLILLLVFGYLGYQHGGSTSSEKSQNPEPKSPAREGVSEQPDIPADAREAGLVLEEGYPLIIANCSGCHSLKLVTQNRATRNGWADLIDWMQEKQNLWDLGAIREPILDYLAKYYGPTETGRRPPLDPPSWYRLENPAYDG